MIEKSSNPPPYIKSRDITVDLLKGFGILTVVAGHCAFPMTLWIDPYAFHMPLFFLISGFYLNLQTRYSFFIYQKAKALLVPYYKYCLLFAFLAFFFHWIGVPFLTRYSILNLFTVQNFVIEPFVQSQQFWLIRPLWFVTTLFLAMILVGASRSILQWGTQTLRRSLITFSVLIVLCEVIASFAPEYGTHKWWAISARVLIAWNLCLIGFVFWTNRQYFLNVQFLVVLSLCFVVLAFIYHPAYALAWGNFKDGSVKHLFPVFAITGLYFSLAFCEIVKVCKVTVVTKSLAWLGKNSFHIMTLHLLGFLLLNLFIAYCSDLATVHHIKGIYFRFPNFSPWMYFVIGTIFSVLGTHVYHCVDRKFQYWIKQRLVERKA